MNIVSYITYLVSLSHKSVDDSNVLDVRILHELLLQNGSENSERHVVHTEIPPKLGGQALPKSLELLRKRSKIIVWIGTH